MKLVECVPIELVLQETLNKQKIRNLKRQRDPLILTKKIREMEIEKLSQAYNKEIKIKVMGLYINSKSITKNSLHIPKLLSKRREPNEKEKTKKKKSLYQSND